MSGNADKADSQAIQEQNLEVRTALNDAYAAIEGAKAVQSFAALTFEDLADQQIQRISGPDVQGRPNELNRVQRVLQDALQAVAKIKSLPADAFQDPDPTRDVNTPS